jgi:hypothetical protein
MEYSTGLLPRLLGRLEDLLECILRKNFVPAIRKWKKKFACGNEVD